MTNTIITIGREFGSGGCEIGHKLAEKLGIKCYDKDMLDLAAKESGFSEKFFEQNDEQKGFLKTHFHVQLPLLGSNGYYAGGFSEEKLYQFQSDAIRAAAEQHPRCVFVGRTADYILRDNKDTINIFITASMDFRVKNVCERRDCTEEKARKMIENGESERAKYYNYYTGKTWGDARNYDLCVDASILGIERTKDFIAEFIKATI